MATTRISRTERKERTRAELVAAARRVFVRAGFHGATLEDIAEEAGYTKGAVYSNFAGKDELFLAVLDVHFDARTGAYRTLILDQERLDDAYRAVARFIADADEREPEWSRLLLEFWAHASRREELRPAVRERRERFFRGIADVIDALAARHGVRYRLPTVEVARGSGALLRGMGMERMLAGGTLSVATFEEMHAAYMRGLTVTPDERSDP